MSSGPPSRRPQSAVELRDALAACEVTEQWTERDAQRWWDTYLPEEAGKGIAEATG